MGNTRSFRSHSSVVSPLARRVNLLLLAVVMDLLDRVLRLSLPLRIVVAGTAFLALILGVSALGGGGAVGVGPRVPTVR